VEDLSQLCRKPLDFLVVLRSHRARAQIHHSIFKRSAAHVFDQRSLKPSSVPKKRIAETLSGQSTDVKKDAGK